MADINQIYQQIKGLETTFPLPVPSTSLDMGTFNALSGKFNGIVSTLEVIDEEPNDPQRPHPKPQRVLVPPTVAVNAVNVTLVFHVSNRQGVFRVTANGQTVTATGSQTTIQVGLGHADDVTWTVQAG